MKQDIEQLISSWSRRNIEGLFCRDKKEALSKLRSLIPEGASIGFSGSVTLNELGIIDFLKEKGHKVFDPYVAGISAEESRKIRKDAVGADYYLASANAVAKTGELVFFSAFGNRTSGIAYAKNVVVVCGANKICPDLSGAIKRAREYATPLNCKRLGWNTPCFKDGICREELCFSPEYKRMCCQVLIIEAEVEAGRLKIVIVGENLGF